MSGTLRIVAGRFGGRSISCPSELSRPTVDRVREAIASSIVSLLGGLEGVSVCDAFAGSGAMGLEMLSRGARSLQLFDKERVPLRCVQDNIQRLGVQSQAHAARRNVLVQGISGPFAPYGLLLLDPPYAESPDAISSLVQHAADQGCLEKEALIVYEHAAAAADIPLSPPFVLVRQKRYGKTAVDYLSWGQSV